jgi:nicotinamidase-related amidase
MSSEQFMGIILLFTILFVTIICIAKNVNNRYNKLKALIIVDPQYDFCEGGSLEVPYASSIFSEINKLKHESRFDRVFITKDSHPQNHISFAVNHNKKPFTKINHNISNVDYLQDLWPIHCVVNSRGCMINEQLYYSTNDTIILKGILPNVDSYSGFGDAFNNRFEKTSLHRHLTKSDITELVICGLATDYCVLATALDAIRLGFTVTIIHSTIKGVAKETTEKAIEKMTQNGVKFLDTVEDYLGKQELIC